MKTVLHNSINFAWEGAISLQHTEEWTCPWRIPYSDRDLFFEKLVERASMPSGIRLTFRSDTTKLSGEIVPDPEMSNLDLHIDGKMESSHPMAGVKHFSFGPLPAGEKLFELWLPQWGCFRLCRLSIDTDARIEPAPDRHPAWVTYGSSITQCRTASSPSFTWPAIVARTHGLNLTSLGYAGQCQMDPMIARLIRDRHADYISLCIGINIHGSSSLNLRTFGASVIGMIKTIRDGHPKVPIAVISPIISPSRETGLSGAGLSLCQMRNMIEDAVSVLRNHGDEHVHYISGLDIFGAEHLNHLSDGCHPDSEGYRIIAGNFLRLVAEKYFVGHNSAHISKNN